MSGSGDCVECPPPIYHIHQGLVLQVCYPLVTPVLKYEYYTTVHSKDLQRTVSVSMSGMSSMNVVLTQDGIILGFLNKWNKVLLNE